MRSSSTILTQMLGFLASIAIAQPANIPRDASGLVHPSSLPGWPGLKNDGAVLDGIYIMTYNDNGTAKTVTYQASQSAENRTITERAALDNVVGCDDISLDKAELDKATGMLQDACSPQPRGTVWAISGDSVAFYCEWERSAQCTKSSAQWAWGYITGYCNTYRAGSVSDTYERWRHWSYGYTNWRHHDFCNILL